MNINEYEEYLKNWINGIKNEVEFWDTLFASGGSVGGNSDVFRYRLNETCPFQIKEDLDSLESKILDVGSGPYSRLGFYVDDKKMNITLADPLARMYKRIATKYNITLPIEPVIAMVEFLHLFFKKNQYDLVHMSNALDHCFHPIWGIMELLYVTQVGGKVILRHNNNEAENEQYKGFHQWNLTINGDLFVVWRKNAPPIVVNDLIEKYAKIEFIGTESERTLNDLWSYNKVVIRKLNDFELDDNVETEMFTKLVSIMIETYSFER